MSHGLDRVFINYEFLSMAGRKGFLRSVFLIIDS